MKLIILLALVAYASAATYAVPAPKAAIRAAADVIPIISQDSELNFDGSYHSAYETGNGIKASEEGSVKAGAKPDEAIVEVTGSFTYTGDDGVVYTIEYVANENGFQPRGAHIPVGPEIPAAIARSLEYNAAHPQENEPSSGSRPIFRSLGEPLSAPQLLRGKRMAVSCGSFN